MIAVTAIGLILMARQEVGAQSSRITRPAQDLALTAPPLVIAPDARIPVELRAASIAVEVNGGLARTTLSLTLYNPNDRLLEGNLEFPLQPDQLISGFALDIDGQLRDAVPVPKPKAQQVFESIERRNVDPGLLEQTAGNHFRLRVYPIPARGTRQVRLLVDEALRRDGAAWLLQVPVHLLADADSASLSIRARGIAEKPQQDGRFDPLRFERERGAYSTRYERLRERVSYAPISPRPLSTLSLRLPVTTTAQSYVQNYDGERFGLIDIPVPANKSPAAVRRLPTSVGLLWDASGSARGRDRQTDLALLDRYFRAMGEGRVSLRLLRDVGEDGGDYVIRGGDWSDLRAAIEGAVYDGASDLADWTAKAGIEEYLLVSDGLRNYGSAGFPSLREGQRLYALSSAGAATDTIRLSALAEARGGRLVHWQGRDQLDAAADALLRADVRIVGLEGEGIEDLCPQTWSADHGLLRVAGRLTEADATIRIRLNDGGVLRTIEASVGVDDPHSDLPAALWANWQVAALASEPERHRGAITRLGQRFGLVTPGTSLLVLEAAEDYVRYDIPAPAALRAQVAQLKAGQAREETRSREQRLDAVARRFDERIAWWERRFPKDSPVKIAAQNAEGSGGATAAAAEPVADLAAPPPPPAPPPGAPASGPQQETAHDAIVVTGARVSGRSEERARRADAPARRIGQAEAKSEHTVGEGVSIKLQPVDPDSPYARRLREAAHDEIYPLYLDERDNHADSTAFYLDVGDLLLKKGHRGLALRVLSNLAEMGLENRHILRVLGYRLMQAGDYARAVEIFREVLRLAEEEPQSHRDLGLALAAAGQRQEAIKRLYEVAAREWDGRFSEVEAVALNEMNVVIATSPLPLDTTFIDARLLKNMPLDLRAVLSWDSDNSDMDLWVTDPNGERCYYGNRNTYQGGLLSDDFTGGYGPEEFVLRSAKPGKYKVEANFFGDNQQIVTGATTLSLTLSTGWGSARQKDQKVTLRLSGKSETVLVGEFEVK
ncbi:MAG: DUF2135 domain-containing protein [Lysobacteraceae bacterium]|nr:MAG: DUF2135 domain-containing protein [Xanthomonadaceae bacterium]